MECSQRKTSSDKHNSNREVNKSTFSNKDGRILKGNTFFHKNGSFLSLGKRRSSRNQEATTQGSPSPLPLFAVVAFSSSMSQIYRSWHHFLIFYYCTNVQVFENHTRQNKSACIPARKVVHLCLIGIASDELAEVIERIRLSTLQSVNPKFVK